jgi:hypothetical protein
MPTGLVWVQIPGVHEDTLLALPPPRALPLVWSAAGRLQAPTAAAAPKACGRQAARHTPHTRTPSTHRQHKPNTTPTQAMGYGPCLELNQCGRTAAVGASDKQHKGSGCSTGGGAAGELHLHSPGCAVAWPCQVPPPAYRQATWIHSGAAGVTGQRLPATQTLCPACLLPAYQTAACEGDAGAIACSQAMDMPPPHAVPTWRNTTTIAGKQ